MGTEREKRVLLLYYTGTYNTRFLTEKLAEKFRSLGYETDRAEITAETPVLRTEDYGLVGFGYPIYGFNAPRPFLRYFKKLDFCAGQKFFIYKNSGETYAMNNASSRKILRAMKRKGCVLCGEYHFVMPYNIHFPFEKEFIRQIVYEDKRLMEILFRNLARGAVSQIKSNPLYNIGAFFVGIQAAGGTVNSFFYRVDRDKCIGCGLCAKHCPENNIRSVGGKIKFGHRCDMCMRCSFYCPAQAVRIGLLDGWRVGSYYDLDEYWRSKEKPNDYVTRNSKGFYRCYIRYFENIEKQYRDSENAFKTT